MTKSKRYPACGPLTTIFLGVLSCSVPSAKAVDWPPVSKQELAMADDPANPGATAILLYREVNTDDPKALQTEYRRIKVLNEEGKKLADIEIPYLDNFAQIENIQARTVRPDGTTVNFEGQIYDRTVVKARKVKLQVKTFTLPDVRTGSILEYSYTVRLRQKAPDVLKNPRDYIITTPILVPSADWTVQEDLFTRKARFSVRPFPSISLRWVLRSIPSNVHPVTQTDGTTTLEVANLPAFQAEEYMPPEAWVRGRVGFFYLLGPPVSRTFWMDAAKTMAEVLAPFLGDAKKLKPVVAGIISAGDSPDTQLRKLYHRVQQIRYISYEPSKTGQETRRENLKENKNVEDVLKHDYAYSNEINLVLVALARAAGFEAAPLRLKSRDTGFFAGEYPNLSQLDAMVVWARAGEKDYLLDPATQYCPFDLLPWPETAATGIAITAGLTSLKSNESIANFDSLITTPGPTSETAMIERNTVVQLNGEGDVDGTIEVRFVGQEALSRRIAARNMDEAARKKVLEEEIKGWVSIKAAVELQGTVNWDQPEQELRANFTVKVPAYATATGRRLLLRAGLFEGRAEAFQDANRIHDIYFPHPFEEVDETTWKLPSGHQVRSLPEKKSAATIFGDYAMSVENSAGALHATRHFTARLLYLPVSYYAAVRSFFNSARLSDETQIVLDTAEEPNATKTN